MVAVGLKSEATSGCSLIATRLDTRSDLLNQTIQTIPVGPNHYLRIIVRETSGTGPLAPKSALLHRHSHAPRG